jgi:hypothetical protein
MNLSKKVVLALIVAGGCALVSSCVTSRIDTFLVNELSPKEKAAILFDRCVKTYNEDVIGKGDVSSVNRLRADFNEVLDLDPLNTDAEKYIADLDSWADRRFALYLKNASALAASAKRTDAQNYDMILAIENAARLKSGNKDVTKLQTSTKDVRANVIQTRVNQLKDLQLKIKTENDQQKLVKLIRSSDALLDQINAIDPNNGETKTMRKETDARVKELVEKDLKIAREKLEAKKYADAETALLRADKSVAAITNEKNAEVQDLKYKLYYSWGSSLYSAKKLQSAGEKANLALKANETREAALLKAKIDKAATTRDYDADIDDILSSVDSLLAKGDPASALATIKSNLPNLKMPANKASLSAKQDLVFAQRDRIYKDAIALYNDEDYEGARQKFQIVTAIDASYEQAQSYLDKANTKIKALSGTN